MDNEFNKFGAWEDAWQQAFNDAEQAPPKKVWQGLENSLMEQQLRRYRRKLFLYQWLAAASVMLLGLWAGWWAYTTQIGTPVREIAQTENSQNAVAYEQRSLPQQPSLPHQQPLPQEESQNSATAAWSGEGVQPRQENGTLFPQRIAATDQEQRASEAIPAETSKAQSPAGHAQAGYSGGQSRKANPATPTIRAEESLDRNASSRQPALDAVVLQDGIADAQELPGTVPPQDPAAADIAVAASEKKAEMLLLTSTEMLVLQQPSLTGQKPLVTTAAAEEVEKEIRVVASSSSPRESRKKQIFGNGSLWLGASLATNVFDPNMANARNYELAWAAQPPGGKGGQVYTANVGNWDEKEQSLPSIDFKLDAGFRLSNRWMLQSSVKYGSYRVNTMTGIFTDQENQVSYPLYYTNFSYDKLQVASANSRVASPIEAQNTYKFLSIPLSFSYILVEKGFGLAISSGISSDFFLGGYIDGTDNTNFWNLQRYDISAGESSPFRKVHFNALLGAQLFYRAGPNYMITLEPTYKYAITDFHRSSSFFGSRPTQFGVAAGFRFILR